MLTPSPCNHPLLQCLHILVLVLASLLLFPQMSLANDAPDDFAIWLQSVREEALAAGVSEKTLDEALAGLHAPEPKVIASDKKQPESKVRFQSYVTGRVSSDRIAAGREMLKRYQDELDRVENKYRVQKRFIVALWGLESTYGRFAGKEPVIQSLATLAYDGRRKYFRKELIEALKILDEGHVTLAEMKGSWAGAMGHVQFMPTSYRHYAVDGDGDGRIDIWNSIPDALASAANYLAEARWKYDQTWGRQVRLPDGFDPSLADLDTRYPLSKWQELGVRRIDGGNLPSRDLKAALIIPEGIKGPAYLVYDNFRALRRWNRSHAFGVTVGTLADRF